MNFEQPPKGPEPKEFDLAEVIKEKTEGLSDQEKSFVEGIRAHDAILDLIDTKLKDNNPELHDDIREELIRLFESLHDVYKKQPASERKSSMELEAIGGDLNKKIGSIGELGRKGL